jgi:limonene-1,2-epoxide hydrolase
MPTPVEVVKAWTAAYNARDAEALVALAHEDVELLSPRGVEHGHEAVRESVRRQSYGVGMHVAAQRYFHRGQHVVIAGNIELRFVDSGELAERLEAAAAFDVRDGRVARVEPHADLPAALTAAGVDPSDEVPGS